VGVFVFSLVQGRGDPVFDGGTKVGPGEGLVNLECWNVAAKAIRATGVLVLELIFFVAHDVADWPKPTLFSLEMIVD
jgi:hypothetical protein